MEKKTSTDRVRAFRERKRANKLPREVTTSMDNGGQHNLPTTSNTLDELIPLRKDTVRGIEHLNATDSGVPSTHEGTNIVRAFTEWKKANKPPRKVPKSSLERSREYRARQRALKKHDGHHNLPTTSNALDESKPSLSEDTVRGIENLNATGSGVPSKRESTDRVRAFRERKRANKPPKKVPKSTLERSREYRARQRALKKHGGQQNLPTTSNSLDESIPSLSEDTSGPSQLCENIDQNMPSNYNLMNLHPAQLEYSDLAISDVSGGEEKPVIFHVVPEPIEVGMPDVTIETVVKQEIEDIPEFLINDSSPSHSFASCDRGSPTHITEAGQQLATLCEVYMPPSPTSNKEYTDHSDDESIPDCIEDFQQIKRLKAEVMSLRRQLANLESGLRTFLDEDQLLYLRQKSPKRFTWSYSTLRKAKTLQAACGTNGYSTLCEMGFPLPVIAPVVYKMKQFSAKVTGKSYLKDSNLE